MKRIYFIPIITIALLIIPFTAMQFTKEVDWSLMDFLLMGLMLLGVGIAIEIILKKIQQKRSRIALLFTVVILFLLIWTELAVGLFCSPLTGS